MWHVWAGGNNRVSVGKPEDYLEDLGVAGRILLTRIFTKLYGGQNGSIWLRTGTGGGLLRIR